MTPSLSFRYMAAWTTLTALVALTPAAAQRPRPITWCEHPSREAKWSTQEITVKIAQRTAADGDSTSTPSTLETPVLERILENLAARMERLGGISKTRNGGLPAADHRYTPAVIRTEVDFTLRGDGTLASVTAGPHSDTLFASDLITAVRQSGDAGELVIDGDPKSRFDFEFFVTPLRSGLSEWRAFTLFAPRALPALVDRQRPAIQYPGSAVSWEATVVLQFVVGWDGKPRRETMRVVPAIDTYPWSAKEREMLEKFVRNVKYAVAQWEFLPGEIAGCLIDELVEHKFVFRTK